METKDKMRERATSTLTIRVDNDLKDEAVAVLEDMGLNLTSGITVFLKTIAREKKIPFEIRTSKED